MKEDMLKKRVVVSLDSKDIDSDYIAGMKELNRLDEDDEINEYGYALIKNVK